ncbi:hypothetical protein [Janibacter cremeus]|uniref:Uncharacterized protein n=1 Tax=Janibacter cremeus TaxID=1285192 RepID=A0A852VLL5_9MICO|nr:hypothetical protein [Janibacter cremeus]NYF96819.1 hypothetical protein [Janibacter cremeus]
MSRRAGTSLTIDCATCPVQDVGCAECMVSVLRPPVPLEDPSASDLPLDRREREVVSRLVASGLVGAENATRARAQREPWSSYDGVANVANRAG